LVDALVLVYPGTGVLSPTLLVGTFLLAGGAAMQRPGAGTAPPRHMHTRAPLNSADP